MFVLCSPVDEGRKRLLEEGRCHFSASSPILSSFTLHSSFFFFFFFIRAERLNDEVRRVTKCTSTLALKEDDDALNVVPHSHKTVQLHIFTRNHLKTS